jgi:hypothetical protein
VIQDPIFPFTGDGPDLLRQDVLQFVYGTVRFDVRSREHVHHLRVEQTLFDRAGHKAGRVEEQPPGGGIRPTIEGWAPVETVRAGVYDAKGTKIIAFAVSDAHIRYSEPSKLFGSIWTSRLDVTDGAGRPIGTLFVDAVFKRGAFEAASSERIGTISPKRGLRAASSFEFAIHDSEGTEVGWIATPVAHGRRAGVAVSRMSVKEWLFACAPERHFLAITRDVTPDLRLMMLAASAGVHLVLSQWAYDNDE